MTTRPFHMASVIVNPKPSRRLIRSLDESRKDKLEFGDRMFSESVCFDSAKRIFPRIKAGNLCDKGTRDINTVFGENLFGSIFIERAVFFGERVNSWAYDCYVFGWVTSKGNSVIITGYDNC